MDSGDFCADFRLSWLGDAVAAGTWGDGLLYHDVYPNGKTFRPPGGAHLALVFALTPAVVVAARNNTIDAQLIFLLVATCSFSRPLKLQSGVIFLAALFIDGFNIKMLQAHMILPAVAMVYLVFGKEKIQKKRSWQR